MKSTILAAMLSGLAFGHTKHLTICAEEFRSQVIQNAASVATGVLARDGIQAEWFDKGSCPTAERAIQIHFTFYEIVQDRHPGAFANAQPFEGTHIEVFYNRVQREAAAWKCPRLLGYMQAHEVVHLLQRGSSHSYHGLMKAHWDREEYDAIQRGPLALDEGGLNLFRSGQTVIFKRRHAE